MNVPRKYNTVKTDTPDYLLAILSHYSSKSDGLYLVCLPSIALPKTSHAHAPAGQAPVDFTSLDLSPNHTMPPPTIDIFSNQHNLGGGMAPLGGAPLAGEARSRMGPSSPGAAGRAARWRRGSLTREQRTALASASIFPPAFARPQTSPRGCHWLWRSRIDLFLPHAYPP